MLLAYNMLFIKPDIYKKFIYWDMYNSSNKTSWKLTIYWSIECTTFEYFSSNKDEKPVEYN